MPAEITEEELNNRVDTELVSETLRIVLWSLLKAQGLDLTNVSIEQYRFELKAEDQGEGPGRTCWVWINGRLKKVPC